MANLISKTYPIRFSDRNGWHASNEAYYGPWTKNEFTGDSNEIGGKLLETIGEDCNVRDMGILKENLPVGLCVAVYDTDKSVEDDAIEYYNSLTEYWWLGPNLGWQYKVSASGGGGIGSDLPVSVTYLLNVDNPTVNIPANSQGKCSADTLKAESLTRVRITYNKETVNFNDGTGTFDIDGLEDTNLTYDYQFKTIDDDHFIEFYYKFKNNAEIGDVPNNFKATIKVNFLSNYSAFFIQSVNKNDKGYTYRISLTPGYFSIPIGNAAPTVGFDVDRFEYATAESVELTETEFEDIVEVKYMTTTDEYNVICSKDNGTYLIDGASKVVINEEETPISIQKLCGNLNYLKFGECFRISAKDKFVNEYAWVNIIRQSSLQSVIAKDYTFELTNGNAVLASAFKNKVSQVVKVATANKVIFEKDEEKHYATIVGIDIVGVDDYELVLVDFDGNEQEITPLQTGNYSIGIKSYYFNKLSSDCVVTVHAEYGTGDEKKEQDLTYTISFVAGQTGYFLNVYPDVIGMSQIDGQNIPSEQQILFDVYKYNDDGITPVTDLTSEGLYISCSKDPDTQITSLTYDITNKGFAPTDVLNFALIKDGVRWSTESASFYLIPTEEQKLLVNNDNVIIDDDSDNNTIKEVSRTQLSYYDGKQEHQVDFISGDTEYNAVIDGQNYYIALENNSDQNNVFISEVDVDANEMYLQKANDVKLEIEYTTAKYVLYKSKSDLTKIASGKQKIKVLNISDGASYKLVVSPNSLYRYTDYTLTDDSDDNFTFTIAEVKNGESRNVVLDGNPFSVKLFINNVEIPINFEKGNRSYAECNIYEYIGTGKEKVTVNAYYNDIIIDSETVDWATLSKSPFSIQLSNDAIIADVSCDNNSLKTLSTTVVTVYHGNVLLNENDYTVTTEIVSSNSLNSYVGVKHENDIYYLYKKSSLSVSQGYIAYNVKIKATDEYVEQNITKRQTVNLTQSADGVSYKLQLVPNQIYFEDGVPSVSNIICYFRKITNTGSTSGFDGTVSLRYRYLGKNTYATKNNIVESTGQYTITPSMDQLEASKGLVVEACKQQKEEDGIGIDKVFFDQGSGCSIDGSDRIGIFNAKSNVCKSGSNYAYIRLVALDNSYENYIILVVKNTDPAIASVFEQTGIFYFNDDKTGLYKDGEKVIDIDSRFNILYGYTNNKKSLDNVVANGFDTFINSDLAEQSAIFSQDELEMIYKTTITYVPLDIETVGISKKGDPGTNVAAVESGWSIALSNDFAYIDNNSSSDTVSLLTTCELSVYQNGIKKIYNTDYTVLCNTAQFVNLDNSNSTTHGQIICSHIEVTNGNYIHKLELANNVTEIPLGQGYVEFEIFDKSETPVLIGKKMFKFQVTDFSAGKGYMLNILPNSIYKPSDTEIDNVENLEIVLTEIEGKSTPKSVEYGKEGTNIKVAYLDNGTYHEIKHDYVVSIQNNIMNLSSNKNIDITNVKALTFVAYIEYDGNKYIVDSETVDFARQGKPGAAGTNGGILRMCGKYDENQAYCYLSDAKKVPTGWEYVAEPDNKYIDIVYVNNDVDEKPTYYQALKGDAKTPNKGKINNSAYWQQVENYNLIITKAMLADTVQAKELIVEGKNGTDGSSVYPAGGMIGNESKYYTDEQSGNNKVIIWAGNKTNNIDNSTFKVYEDGTLYAKTGVFGGSVYDNLTVIDYTNINKYCTNCMHMVNGTPDVSKVYRYTHPQGGSPIREERTAVPYSHVYDFSKGGFNVILNLDHNTDDGHELSVFFDLPAYYIDNTTDQSKGNVVDHDDGEANWLYQQAFDARNISGDDLAIYKYITYVNQFIGKTFQLTVYNAASWGSQNPGVILRGIDDFTSYRVFDSGSDEFNQSTQFGGSSEQASYTSISNNRWKNIDEVYESNGGITLMEYGNQLTCQEFITGIVTQSGSVTEIKTEYLGIPSLHWNQGVQLADQGYGNASHEGGDYSSSITYLFKCEYDNYPGNYTRVYWKVLSAKKPIIPYTNYEGIKAITDNPFVSTVNYITD